MTAAEHLAEAEAHLNAAQRLRADSQWHMQDSVCLAAIAHLLAAHLKTTPLLTASAEPRKLPPPIGTERWAPR